MQVVIILKEMKGYITNIEQVTRENTDFRRVLYTSHHSQLVVMSIPAGEDIGEEVHDLDQFIRIEAGEGLVVLDGKEHSLPADSAVVIPAGTRHNIINQGTESLQLYTIYSPPEHKDGILHRTKAEALSSEEHFDGQTSETS